MRKRSSTPDMSRMIVIISTMARTMRVRSTSPIAKPDRICIIQNESPIELKNNTLATTSPCMIAA